MNIDKEIYKIIVCGNQNDIVVLISSINLNLHNFYVFEYELIFPIVQLKTFSHQLLFEYF